MWIAARTLAAVLCMAGVAATYWAARASLGRARGAGGGRAARVRVPAGGLLAHGGHGRGRAARRVARARLRRCWAYEDGRLRYFARPGPPRASRWRSSTRRDWRSLPLAIAAFARLRADPAAPARRPGRRGGAGRARVRGCSTPTCSARSTPGGATFATRPRWPPDEPKPGQESGGISYYLDSLTWGLGWAAAIAALVGAALELRRSLVRGLMLVAVPLALFVYLSDPVALLRALAAARLPGARACSALWHSRGHRADRCPRADAPGPRAPLPRPHRRRGAGRPDRARARAAARGRHPQRAGARPRRHPPAGARLDRVALPAGAALSVEPAVPGRWFRSNPEGDPPSWLSRCERRAAGPSRAGHTWRIAASASARSTSRASWRGPTVACGPPPTTPCSAPR